MLARYALEGAAFLLMDADNLQINDTYGHQVGDEVLIFFVDVFKEVCTEDDVISRWGGRVLL